MPIDYCCSCGSEYSWQWEEAFDKFGFNDGDGTVETDSVEQVLTKAGYEVVSRQWGLHNSIIRSIRKNGKELMPVDDEKISIGYDDPREYLPSEIISLLDEEL